MASISVSTPPLLGQQEWTNSTFGKNTNPTPSFLNDNSSFLNDNSSFSDNSFSFAVTESANKYSSLPKNLDILPIPPLNNLDFSLVPNQEPQLLFLGAPSLDRLTDIHSPENQKAGGFYNLFK